MGPLISIIWALIVGLAIFGYVGYFRERWYPEYVKQERELRKQRDMKVLDKERASYLLQLRLENEKHEKLKKAFEDVKGMSAEEFTECIKSENGRIPSDIEELSRLFKN